MNDSPPQPWLNGNLPNRFVGNALFIACSSRSTGLSWSRQTNASLLAFFRPRPRHVRRSIATIPVTERKNHAGKKNPLFKNV
jgi:hypothetical protein